MQPEETKTNQPVEEEKDEGRIVCTCIGIDYKTIKEAVIKEGADSVEKICYMTGANAGCGVDCLPEIEKILGIYGKKKES